MGTLNTDKLLTNEKLEAAFKMIDGDGSGDISIEELKSIFGDNIPDNIWKKMISEVDDNGDGEVFKNNFFNRC